MNSTFPCGLFALPSEITSAGLEKSGVSKSNTLPLISALRFLDLINENSAPTAQLRSLQKSGEEFKHNLEEIIRRAYADPFAWLDPSKDDKEHIRNYFARTYSLAIAHKATALFLDLCDEAGIQTHAATIGRTGFTRPLMVSSSFPVY